MSTNKVAQTWQKETMLQHIMHSHHADFIHSLLTVMVWHKITAMARNHRIIIIISMIIVWLVLQRTQCLFILRSVIGGCQI